VNPSKPHPQITEYVHVLDPWGQALGRDVGTRCLYGVRDIKKSRAYEWCRKAWGYPGEYLWFNNALPGAPGTDMTLKHNFDLCRYYTHYMPTMVLDIQANILKITLCTALLHAKTLEYSRFRISGHVGNGQ